MMLSASLVLPLAGLKYPFLHPVTNPDNDIYGIGVSLDRGLEQLELADELGVNHLLLRVPLWDLERLNHYALFASNARQHQKTLLVNVLQDREHIEDPGRLTSALNRVFEALSPFTHEFQIGNAINRIKWGFFSVSEYLSFFRAAQTIRDDKFRSLELLGPSVIDFEYFYTIRAIFNRQGVVFDRLSSLLYVDRSGSPYSRQLGLFDTAAKIRLLAAIQSLSARVKSMGLYITEVNWPISGTAPYAPTSEKECVSMEQYCEYMQSYFDIAKRSGFVERVYWHQMVAPGYGLVDNRDGQFKKTAAFYAFKSMLDSAAR
jgi:hypothetical protein